MASVEEQLYYAVEGGAIEEVEALLRDNPGIDINWKDHRGWAALHAACGNNDIKIVKLLFGTSCHQCQCTNRWWIHSLLFSFVV